MTTIKHKFSLWSNTIFLDLAVSHNLNIVNLQQFLICQVQFGRNLLIKMTSTFIGVLITKMCLKFPSVMWSMCSTLTSLLRKYLSQLEACPHSERSANVKCNSYYFGLSKTGKSVHCFFPSLPRERINTKWAQLRSVNLTARDGE